MYRRVFRQYGAGKSVVVYEKGDDIPLSSEGIISTPRYPKPILGLLGGHEVDKRVYKHTASL